jgi:hypothetical protein
MMMLTQHGQLALLLLVVELLLMIGCLVEVLEGQMQQKMTWRGLSLAAAAAVVVIGVVVPHVH